MCARFDLPTGLDHRGWDLLMPCRMTLMDGVEMELRETKLQREAPSALRQTLELAVTEKRCLNGTIQCADMLSKHPELVALCVLPETEDVNILIQHKLLQAYCWENDIPVLKVDSADKLRRILTTDHQNDDDYACAIVKNKTESLSSAEITLAKYYAELIKMDVDPHPVIELPV